MRSCSKCGISILSKYWTGALFLAAVTVWQVGCSAGDRQISGSVSGAQGNPIAGIFVTARNVSTGMAVTVVTDIQGEYDLPELPKGTYRVEAAQIGYETTQYDSMEIQGVVRELDFTLVPREDKSDQVPSSIFLSALPEGETKRKFILDCTGCHQFNRAYALLDDRPRSREAWVESNTRMVEFFGASSMFPIIAATRDPERTSDWLVKHLGDLENPSRTDTKPFLITAGAQRAVYTEYDFPVSLDLPHDIMVDHDGRVVITGMFSHHMYRLEPMTGEFSSVPIPVENANPRALDISKDGTWWVLLGHPRKIARYNPRTEEWGFYEIGMYPHSVMLDKTGKIWYNGHFTSDPPLLGNLDPATGVLVTLEVPTEGLDPLGVLSIPYGLRVDSEGSVWVTELHGNRLIKYAQNTGEFSTFIMPTTHSGPRRLDIGPDGRIWIPEYSGNKLAVFDPRTETFKEYDFPMPNALPYVVRVDKRRSRVWIATAAADAIVRFNPRTEEFTVYPLPTRVALIRHIDIDQKTGAVWGAYGDSPAVHPKIVRLEVLTD